jgi:hypothetical protein
MNWTLKCTGSGFYQVRHPHHTITVQKRQKQWYWQLGEDPEHGPYPLKRDVVPAIHDYLQTYD